MEAEKVAQSGCELTFERLKTTGGQNGGTPLTAWAVWSRWRRLVEHFLGEIAEE